MQYKAKQGGTARWCEAQIIKLETKGSKYIHKQREVLGMPECPRASVCMRRLKAGGCAINCKREEECKALVDLVIW